MPGRFSSARLLDLDLVAELLGRSPRTVSRMVRSGEIEGVKVRRAWRVTRPALARFLQCEVDEIAVLVDAALDRRDQTKVPA